MTRALVVWALLASACATNRVTQHPGGVASVRQVRIPDRWRVWDTPHLTLDTDVNETDAVILARELERCVVAFDALLLPDLPRPHGRLRVVLFADSRHYAELGYFPGGQYRAYAPDGESAPTIFMFVSATPSATITAFQHELTHHFVDGLFPQAPVWLNEGLSELWSSLRVGLDDARLGFTPASITGRDLDALFAADAAAFYRASAHNYRLAGAVVEFLWFEQHDRFLGYLHALISGAGNAAAWEANRPPRLRDGFEDWYAWTQRGANERRRTVEKYAFTAPDASAPSGPRLMSSAEVLDMCAMLRSGAGMSAWLQARLWAQAAVAFDPFDPEAYYWAGHFTSSRDGDGGERAFATALALRPDDSRALASLALVRLRQRHRVDDLSTAEPLIARINPRTTLVMPLRVLAWFEHARGNDDAAMTFIERALQRSPACIGCRSFLAALYNLRGHADEAQQQIERMIALLRESRADDDDIRQQFRAAPAALAACDHGDAAACERLADAYESGVGLPEDAALALVAERRACDGGRWRACLRIGDALRRGIGADRDPAAAAELMLRACRAGSWDACNNLGDQYENGDGVARDLVRAVSLYRDACTHDAGYGCISLAALSWRGVALPYDEPRIVDWLRRANVLVKQVAEQLWHECGVDATACALASLAWSNGISVEADVVRAKDLMATACMRGDARACQRR